MYVNGFVCSFGSSADAPAAPDVWAAMPASSRPRASFVIDQGPSLFRASRGPASRPTGTPPGPSRRVSITRQCGERLIPRFSENKTRFPRDRQGRDDGMRDRTMRLRQHYNSVIKHPSQRSPGLPLRAARLSPSLRRPTLQSPASPALGDPAACGETLRTPAATAW
jgi:hypothetical protein